MRSASELRRHLLKAHNFIKRHRGIFEALILICLAYLASYGFSFGLRVALGSEAPISPVIGTSMIPEYHEGDLVIVQGVKGDQIEVGDVITFHEPGNWDHAIIHRVIDKAYVDNQTYFLTKGDNNRYPDPGYIWPLSETPYRGWLPSDHVIGRVIFKIPLLGWLLLITQGYLGKVAVILLAIMIIISLMRGKGDTLRCAIPISATLSLLVLIVCSSRMQKGRWHVRPSFPLIILTSLRNRWGRTFFGPEIFSM